MADQSPWARRVEELAAAGLQRSLRTVIGPVGPRVETPGGSALLFCSNDYLGFAAEPILGRVAADAALELGVGTGGSRLVSGNTLAHVELEAELARFMGTPAAVLFPSGFQANLGALGALTTRGDVIFSDALAHASLIDGCRLSRAQVEIFRHSDVDHLEQLLEAHRECLGIKMIVTDAIFSMDGDRAPIGKICELARSFGALVYLDEAHSLGVCGPQGRGLAALEGVEDMVAVRIGTMGKAMGVSGAFVALDGVAADLLYSGARSLLYTTGAPALLSRVALASLEMMRNADQRRNKLAQNIREFRRLAILAALPLMDSDTPIQPVLIGDSHKTVAVSSRLEAMGIFVVGIRPPTVSPGTGRLRITLSSSHEFEDIGQLVDALVTAIREENAV